MAAAAKVAMESVKPVYLVGDKEYCCPDKAATTAKADGGKVTFAVAGEKTFCEKTNGMNVAVAKYKAAIQAIAKLETPTEEGEKVSQS